MKLTMSEKERDRAIQLRKVLDGSICKVKAASLRDIELAINNFYLLMHNNISSKGGTNHYSNIDQAVVNIKLICHM